MGDGGPRESSTDTGPPVSKEMNDSNNNDDDDPLLGSENPLSINNADDEEEDNPLFDSDDDEGKHSLIHPLTITPLDKFHLVLTNPRP